VIRRKRGSLYNDTLVIRIVSTISDTLLAGILQYLQLRWQFGARMN